MATQTRTRHQPRQAPEPELVDEQMPDGDRVVDDPDQAAGRRRAPSVSTSRRLRRQLAPHYTLGLLALSATATRAAAYLTGAEAEVALTTAGAAFVVAVVASVRARRRLADPREQRWVMFVVGAAASWLTTVTAAGWSWDAAGILTALGYALALPWWRAHRLPNIPDLPTTRVDGPVSYPARWKANCGGRSGGPLPGSWLGDPETIDTGERFTFHLVPGKQTITTAMQALPLLRTGLRLLPGQDLIIEPHPELDEACLQLTIVTKSTVLTDASVPWPGPTYDPTTGTLGLGPFIDGDGIARWRLFSDNSMWGGYLCGVTRSGKSRLLESIALGAAATGLVAVWFGDPQSGASSPMLATHADHVARSVEDIGQMLARALLVKELRQAENAYYGWEGFTPTDDRPGLLIIIDECHRAYAVAAIQAMADELAREGGKVGIALISASQVATLDAFGTGQAAIAADALRGSLLAGNLVILRTKTHNTKNVLPGVDFNPTKFPNIPGYGYLVDQTGTGRSAPLRGYYLDNKPREEWAARLTWRALDPGSGNAAGPGYLHRREQAALDREAMGAKIAAMRAGLPIPTTPGKPPAPAQPAPAAPALAPNRPATPPTPASTATIIAFPSWPPAPAANEGTGPETELTDAQQAVLDAITAGHTRPAEIERNTPIKIRQIHNLLDQLTELGLIKQAGYGRYQPTNRAERAS